MAFNRIIHCSFLLLICLYSCFIACLFIMSSFHQVVSLLYYVFFFNNGSNVVPAVTFAVGLKALVSIRRQPPAGGFPPRLVFYFALYVPYEDCTTRTSQ